MAIIENNIAMNQKHEIIICLGSSCFARGNRDSLKFIEKYIKENKLSDRVDFRGKLCSGNCGKGPILFIDKLMHDDIKVDQLQSILDALFFEK
jgi:NADH:ubiquinone oxidoreductase subunit E